jgi:pimeloyl-ACP methyl ester carboxylesterase
VGGPARELALDMNRIVLANGEDDDGASGVDAPSRLGEVRVPAIVACGELDLPLKLERCATLAAALPDADHRTLPGRAHLPYLEAPGEVAALLR